MDQNVVKEILELGDSERAVLATIIATTGSTPCKAGANVLN